MWHVLGYFIHGSKAHQKHILEFRTCSVTMGGAFKYMQGWQRLTERSNKDDSLFDMNVFLPLFAFIAQFWTQNASSKEKPFIFFLKDLSWLHNHTGHCFTHGDEVIWLKGPGKCQVDGKHSPSEMVCLHEKCSPKIGPQVFFEMKAIKLFRSQGSNWQLPVLPAHLRQLPST